MRLLLCVFALCAASLSWAETPLEVGDRKQLFIDQRFIARSENITLQANSAQKLGLLLDESGARVQGFVSRVIEHEGKVLLYVGADSVEPLESDDALHFRRTGVRIGGGIFTTVFLDEHDPDPSRRFKAFWIKFEGAFDPAVHGVYGAYSADGIHFTESPERLLPFHTDNPPLMLWDARIGKYVVYTRGLVADAENERRVVRLEVEDPLQPWPYTRTDHDGMFFTPDNAPVVIQADDALEPFTDFYYNAASIYPWAQDAYLMFLAPFRHFAPERQPFIRPHKPGQWEDFGLLEVQLAVSRDGIHWDRPTHDAYFPTGLADEWDRWYAVMAPGMARRGNYLYQYYTSSGRTHDSVVLRAEYDNAPEELGGIGIVKQRLDGFVSADVDIHGGWLETPTITFRGARLRLNIDTGSMGTARVELRDEAGAVIPDYSLEDCEEVGGNFIDQSVYWKRNADLSPLQGRPVKLYFSLKRAKLFAFQFTSE